MSEKHPVNKSTSPIYFTQKYSLPLLALPPFLRESRGLKIIWFVNPLFLPPYFNL